MELGGFSIGGLKGVMNKSLKNISLIGKYSQTMEYIPKEDFPNLRIFP